MNEESDTDSKNQDMDYNRNDLEPAHTEELEDKIIDQSRRLKRKLTVEEVNRMSVSHTGS